MHTDFHDTPFLRSYEKCFSLLIPLSAPGKLGFMSDYLKTVVVNNISVGNGLLFAAPVVHCGPPHLSPCYRLHYHVALNTAARRAPLPEIGALFLPEEVYTSEQSDGVIHADTLFSAEHQMASQPEIRRIVLIPHLTLHSQIYI